MGSAARRKSAFRELGLEDFESAASSTSSSSTSTRSSSPSSSTAPARKRPTPSVRFRSTDDVRVVERYEDAAPLVGGEKHGIQPAHLRTSTHAPFVDSQSPLPASNSIMYRFGAAILLTVVVAPFLHDTSFFGHASLPLQPVSGGPLPETAHSKLDRRADSPTDACFRWAQQCMNLPVFPYT